MPFVSIGSDTIHMVTTIFIRLTAAASCVVIIKGFGQMHTCMDYILGSSLSLKMSCNYTKAQVELQPCLPYQHTPIFFIGRFLCHSHNYIL